MLPQSAKGGNTMLSSLRFRRLVVSTFALSLAAAVVPLVVASTPAGAASTIKVGLLADNTGVYSAVFSGVTTGMEAKIKQVNAAGGVKGHQISYTVLDTQSSPTQAVAVAKQGVEQGNLALLVGSQFASYALPYLNNQNIPLVGWAVSPGWNGKSMFGFGGSTENKAGKSVGNDAITRFIKAKGFTKIAVLADSSAGSSTAGKGELPLAKRLGLKVVYSDVAVPSYGADLSQVLPVVQKAQQSGAQFILSFMGVNAPMIQAVTQLGNKVKAMVLTGYGPGLVEQLGADMNGIYIQANAAAYITQKGPGITDFLKAMKADGVNGTPLYYNELGYIIATQFVWGLQRAGKNPTQTSLVAALNTMKNETLGGLIPPITYPAMRYSSTPCDTITQVQNGKFVVVGNKPWQCGKTTVSG
jgi:branched-chain amino acid transport system substrate-binding protein